MKYLQFFLVAVLATSAACSGASSAAQATSTSDCITKIDCTIDYDYLSEQDSDPFLFKGIVMDADQPRWHQFRKPLQRYTSVRDCLIPDEQTKRKPNLLLMDWERVGTGNGAEVCIFRIARSLNRTDRITQWLEFHGFRVGEKRRFVSENYVHSRKTIPVANLTAWWTREQYRELNPSLLSRLFGFDLILSYRVVIGFSQDDEITNVGVVTPTK